MVEAKLRRGTTGSTATVDWDIASDTTSPTGFADPIIEPALRVRIGSTTDIASTGDGSVIALLKRARALLDGSGSIALTTATLDALETVTVANTTRTVTGTVALTTATLDALETITVSNTTRTANQGSAGSSPWLARDDFGNFLTTHTTIGPSTTISINLSTAVRMYRVTNWSTSARVLVKTSTFNGDGDGAASRVGVAPRIDIPNSEVFPITSTTLFIRSTGSPEVTVEAFTA